MEKYFHNKLVRDKIPEIIEKRGGKYKTHILKIDEYETELKKKLIEEAKEVQNATELEIIDELADVLELVKSIANFQGIEFEDVEKRQIDKKEKTEGLIKKYF